MCLTHTSDPLRVVSAAVSRNWVDSEILPAIGRIQKSIRVHSQNPETTENVRAVFPMFPQTFSHEKTVLLLNLLRAEPRRARKSIQSPERDVAEAIISLL